MILVKGKTRIMPAKTVKILRSKLRAGLLLEMAVGVLVKNLNRKIQIIKTYLNAD
jgi:hypothetical protein